LHTRIRARDRIGEDAQIVIEPAVVGVHPGDRLLVVRGSGRALGFVARGPILDEALKHPELEVFSVVP
jgi:hypothetical protein